MDGQSRIPSTCLRWCSPYRWRLWRLEKDSVVNVEWNISTLESHPQAFASKVSPGSTGVRLGIRVFKDSGADKQFCLVQDVTSAVRIANTTVDFLKGKIVEKPYVWMDDSEYIFREYSANPEAKGTQRKERKRIGLTYDDSEFIWADGYRKPETKPFSLLHPSIPHILLRLPNPPHLLSPSNFLNSPHLQYLPPLLHRPQRYNLLVVQTTHQQLRCPLPQPQGPG